MLSFLPSAGKKGEGQYRKEKYKTLQISVKIISAFELIYQKLLKDIELFNTFQ
jgi:hypothetical protein